MGSRLGLSFAVLAVVALACIATAAGVLAVVDDQIGEVNDDLFTWMGLGASVVGGALVAAAASIVPWRRWLAG